MQRRNNRQGHPIDHYPFSILILLALGVPFIIFGLWPINSVNFNRSHPGPIFFGGNANPMKVPKTGADYPPILAYTIFGSKRDSWRMLRILKSIYHPRNQYLLYLDERAPNFEREKLRSSVESQKEFCAFGNVYVINKNQVKLMGASSLPAVLHAATLLLSMNADWDWFTALSPSDYPLIPQDDILYMLSSMPRHLNFIQYTNRTFTTDEKDGSGSGKYSIYMKQNTPILPTLQSRQDPNAFKIYRGSPWMILSRNFSHHVICGHDNLPRKLLMYFTNFDFPLEYYFHTVLCNTPEFQNTIVNIDLRCSIQDTRNPKAGILKKRRLHDDLVFETPAVFARPYEEGDPLLEEIDTKILQRGLEGVAPGKWCVGPRMNKTNNEPTKDHASDYEDYQRRAEYFNYCMGWGSINSVKPGKYGIFFQKMFASDAGKRLFITDHCRGFT